MKISFNTRLGQRDVSVQALYERNGDVDGCGGNASVEILQVVDEYGIVLAITQAEEDVLIEKGVKVGTDSI